MTKQVDWGWLLAALYVGGIVAAWLVQGWWDVEFPYREIGAVLWPILPLVLLAKGMNWWTRS